MKFYGNVETDPKTNHSDFAGGWFQDLYSDKFMVFK